MKIVELNSKDFLNFVNNNKYHNYFQTPYYGSLMSKRHFQVLYLGFKENNEIVGACLILYKPLFMGFKQGYIPRGIITNYEQTNTLSIILEVLKKYLFSERFMNIKLDPPVICCIKDRKGKISETNPHFDSIIKTILNNGCVYNKNSNYLTNLKPKWEAQLNINKNAETLFKNFTKTMRNKIRKNKKLGIEIYQDEIININQFFELIQHNDNHTINYYKDLFYYYQNNIEVYYAKLNTTTYINSMTKIYDAELEYNDYLSKIIESKGYKGKDVKRILNKKIESDKLLDLYKNDLIRATNLLNQYPNGVVIGCSLIIKYLDTIYLIKEGYNHDFNFITPTYSTKWRIIEKYANSNYKFFNINFVDGNEKTDSNYVGLNEMKFGYNSYMIEYIGEFDLIVNGPINSLYKKINASKKD